VKVTVTGLDLNTVAYYGADEEPVTLGELVAEHIATQVIGTIDPAKLRELVAAVREAEIRDQVRRQVADAMRGPVGQVPVTLAEVIVAEARSQITSDPDRYQGTSTPLRQVVQAEVYAQLHDEARDLVGQARDTIKEQTRAEITKIIQRQFGAGV